MSQGSDAQLSIRGILWLVLGVAALVGLFGFLLVGLLVIASRTSTTNWYELIVPFFAYAFLWLFVALMVVDSSAYIYGFRRPFFIPRPRGVKLRLSDSSIRTAPGAVLAVFTSYLLTLYGFAVAYLVLSSIDMKAFHPPTSLDPIAALYFSTVTAATVGFGDITPVSAFARVLVTLEILTSVAYSVLLFSVVAGLAWRKAVANSGELWP